MQSGKPINFRQKVFTMISGEGMNYSPMRRLPYTSLSLSLARATWLPALIMSPIVKVALPRGVAWRAQLVPPPFSSPISPPLGISASGNKNICFAAGGDCGQGRVGVSGTTLCREFVAGGPQRARACRHGSDEARRDTRDIFKRATKARADSPRDFISA